MIVHNHNQRLVLPVLLIDQLKLQVALFGCVVTASSCSRFPSCVSFFIKDAVGCLF